MLSKKNLNKLLFLDIETVGIESNLENLEKNRPNLFRLFNDKLDFITKHLREERESLTLDEMYQKSAPLYPELGKIVCITIGILDKNNNVKLQNFYGDDEKKLLSDFREVANRCYDLEYELCGHNIKNFDIPYIGKRFLINELSPFKYAPEPEDKPWELKILDSRDVWRFANFMSDLSSMDSISNVMGLENPKDNDIKGENVHENYWKGNLEEIKNYCEKDVLWLHTFLNKIKNFK